MPTDPVSEPAPLTVEEAAAAGRAIVRLFGHWRLSDADAAALLGLAPSTFGRWKAGEVGPIDGETRIRLFHLLGIHRALTILFVEPRRRNDWMSAPNAAFGGRSALDVLRGGTLDDVVRVRHYVDAEVHA